MSEQTKATISFKAESLPALLRAFERIAEDAGMQIVMRAAVNASMTLEADDLDDLGLAIGDVATAVEKIEGVACKVSAPGSVWHARRLDLTPMERYINENV